MRTRGRGAGVVERTGDCDSGSGGGKESGGFGAGGGRGADDAVSLAEERSGVYGGVQRMAARDAGDGQGAIGGIDGWGGNGGGGGESKGDAKTALAVLKSLGLMKPVEVGPTGLEEAEWSMLQEPSRKASRMRDAEFRALEGK